MTELDRFQLNRNETTGNTDFKFWNGHDWVSLINSRNGKFLALRTLRDRMKEEAMKNMLGLAKTPSERSKTAARKVAKSIPTDLEMDNISMQDLSRVLIDVAHEVRETSQITDLDMLGVIEPLQRIYGKVGNIEGKVTAINDEI